MAQLPALPIDRPALYRYIYDRSNKTPSGRAEAVVNIRVLADLLDVDKTTIHYAIHSWIDDGRAEVIGKKPYMLLLAPPDGPKLKEAAETAAGSRRRTAPAAPTPLRSGRRARWG